MARSYGLRPGFFIDITCPREDGSTWDLLDPKCQKELERLQAEQQPELLIGSPPCTSFCSLLFLTKTKDQIEQLRQEGREHVRICVEAYKRQLAMGKHFLHEHPAHSASWMMPEVSELINTDGVYLVQGPMCRWQMKAVDNYGEEGFVRKETKWLTSSPRLATLLSGRCNQEHRHVHLIGKHRTQAAARYPPKLVSAILRTLKKQLVDDRGVDVNAFFDSGPTADDPEPDPDGWAIEFDYDAKGELLDPEKVKAGKAEEIKWILQENLFDYVPEQECREKQGRPYTLKWVLVNKGDKVRARLVAREVKRAKTEEERLEPNDVFSAMPPVESLKALVSYMMTELPSSAYLDLRGSSEVSEASKATATVAAAMTIHRGTQFDGAVAATKTYERTDKNVKRFLTTKKGGPEWNRVVHRQVVDIDAGHVIENLRITHDGSLADAYLHRELPLGVRNIKTTLFYHSKPKGQKRLSPEVFGTRFSTAASAEVFAMHAGPKDHKQLVLAVYDVSRAHFYGKSEREVFVRPPPELHKEGMVAKLNRTMYGTQDAARIWMKTWGEHLRNNGFELGVSNPSLFRSANVVGFCHGDDFTICTTEAEAEKFGKLLGEKFEVRRTGLIGFAPHLPKELEVLRRKVRIVDDNLMEVEADARHVEQLLKDLSLTKGNTVTTPRVKSSAKEAEAIEKSPLLDPASTTLFRSGTMRCAYLGQDRVDISESVKCLARAMSSPREGHLQQLKRLARYLKGAPACVLQYPRQSLRSSEVFGFVDSDWAGDPISRRSTTGVVIMLGRHLLRHSSTVQNVIGLSSAESEYYALTKGACTNLGVQSHLRDWGIHVDVVMFTDSSSAKAIATRRGVGKHTRHLQTRLLWLQERIAARHLQLRKVWTEDNPADILTKALAESRMRKLCEMCGHAWKVSS